MLAQELEPQWIVSHTGPREAWTWLQYFEVPEHAERLIDRRMKYRFGGLEAWRIERAWGRARRQGVPARMHDGPQKRAYARRIGAALHQAREIWQAAVLSPPLSKPILLMYAAEHLAQALILATYRTSIARSHGLDWQRDDRFGDAVRVRNAGLFQQLHDSHSQSPHVYLREPSFSLRELFSVNIDLLDEYYMSTRSMPRVPLSATLDWEHELSTPSGATILKDNSVFRLHPIDYRFLSLFVLGSKARYQPWEWADYLKTSDGFVAQIFLHRTEERLPALFLNELLNQALQFGSQPNQSVGGSWSYLDI